MLALAYWCNIIISPAYFSNIGSATMKDNVVGNIIIALFNIFLCIILGHFFKGYGVVAGWSLSLALGSLYIMYNHHRKNRVKISQLLSKSDFVIIVLSTFYCLLLLLFFTLKSDLNVWLMFATDIFIFFLICLVIYFIHPVRKTFVNGINGLKK
jgi:O-antigen/teichoic acid export membrane protein